MLLRVDLRPSQKKCKHGRRARAIELITRTKKIAVLQCDQCKSEFERTGKERIVAMTHHFCSRRCRYDSQRVAGILYAKIEETTMKFHGVRRAFLKPEVLKRSLENSHSLLAQQRRSISLKIFHETRPSDWVNKGNSLEACAKRHATMKRNGTYATSKVEDELYTYLCETYGIAFVNRSVLVNDRWPIDFYVTSIDTYIQLDGVYWHGIDRPIKIISEHKNKRDVQIHKKWKTDREQDRWFAEHGLKLMRITDIEFSSGRRP